MIYSIVILLIVFGFLIIEKMVVSRSVASMNLRIHVNGTRGKSSVTEYIAAGIVKSDPKVMAKVTGVIPTVIFNNKGQTIKRFGVARVQEQFNIMNQAARAGVKSLVMECMSISPDLQRLESRVFKPHIYVITNIRDDHREAMGRCLEEQAISICNAIPYNCKVVTNELQFLELITKTSAERGSTVITPSTNENVSEINIPYGVFPENLALAAAVCREAGIDYADALNGILDHVNLAKSPLVPLKSGAGEIYFLNAFSVNDLSSTKTFIKYWQERSELGNNFSVLINTRADRPLRTGLFVKWIVEELHDSAMIFISGSHSGRAKAELRGAGIGKDRIRIIKRNEIKSFDKILFDLLPDGSFVVGVGNISGDGNKILKAIL